MSHNPSRTGWGPEQLDLAFSSDTNDLWLRGYQRPGVNPALLGVPSGRKH